MQEKTGNIIRKILLNKYTLTLILFILWVGLFDKNSFLEQRKYINRINDLKQQKAYYIAKYKEDSTKLEEFKSPEKLEKFARENYFMKKDNEDLFVILHEE